MKYALVNVNGKQIKIEEGQQFLLDPSEKLNFEVLAYSNGEEFTLGTPVVPDVTITAKVIGEHKVKTTVARFKSKSRYDKVKGHKQPFQIVKIEKISAKGEKEESKPVEVPKGSVKKPEKTSTRGKKTAVKAGEAAKSVSKTRKSKSTGKKVVKKEEK